MTGPGGRETRLLLRVPRHREFEGPRFARDLLVPPTSDRAERDLRLSRVQENIPGRLIREERTKDHHRVRGYLSNAARHGPDMMDSLRKAFTGQL